MPMRPEADRAQHMMAFRALWQWPDRATFEVEIGSLRRGLDAGKRRSLRPAQPLVRFVYIQGKG